MDLDRQIERIVVLSPWASTLWATLGGFATGKLAASCTDDPDKVGMAVAAAAGTITVTLAISFACNRWADIQVARASMSEAAIRRPPTPPGWREFEVVAGRLADTAERLQDAQDSQAIQMWTVPVSASEAVMVHITSAQMRYMRVRIRAGFTKIPYRLYEEGDCPFTRAPLVKFRYDLRRVGLATFTKGNECALTPAGCLGLLRAQPPSPTVFG